MDPKLEQGHFAKKQLFSKSGIIRWSHRRRFEVAIAKSAAFAGKRVLDFGCGDGTYLAMLLESANAPAEAVGAELDPKVVGENRTRFGGRSNLQFVLQSDLEAPAAKGTFDAVVCMECFEHMTDPDRYLDLLLSLLKPGGKLLLSVPVETGLPVVFKQIIRRVGLAADWRLRQHTALHLGGTGPERLRRTGAAHPAGAPSRRQRDELPLPQGIQLDEPA